MKGHVINLDGQLVCIFPFTNATEFEGLAHNDLKSYALVYDDGKDYEPFSLERVNTEETANYYGFCFVSCPINAVEKNGYCIIKKSDRDALADVAAENDAWAAEQVKETDRIASQASTHVKIHVKGGCVTEVEASPVSVTYQIVDFDFDDEDRERISNRVIVSGVIDAVAEAELRSEEQLAEMMYNDEGPEREFDVEVLENWKMLVSYKVMATSKQAAKDLITDQEVDFYHKELIEEDYVEWKKVEEA